MLTTPTKDSTEAKTSLDGKRLRSIETSFSKQSFTLTRTLDRMNQSDLLQALRHQVVNDELGTICCCPREPAAKYFALAKKVRHTTPHEEPLFTLLLRQREQGSSLR